MVPALFDKSFLQSLSLNESVWFDHFFYPVVCPLFYVETLADLEKAVRAGRTPEQEVGLIAEKTPEMHGGPCVHHGALCVANLLGRPVPMNGRIPVAGGRPVRVKEKSGVVFRGSPEAEAFTRWQEGKFLQVERQFAQEWRASLASLNLPAVAASMKSLGVDAKMCKSLEEAKRIADALTLAKDKPFDRMKLAFLFLNIQHQYERPILERWSIAGYPPLSEYAPYAAHVLTVEVFFQIALGANLISPERASNRVDIAYVFYVPFCMVFISSDKLHKRCTPHFLRADQEFVWGEDLKADLRRLNDRYATLPEEVKEQGIMRFATSPPEDGDFLVSRLWDRHLRTWRGKSTQKTPTDPEKEKELVAYLNRFTDAPTASGADAVFDFDDADTVSIQRLVQKRKGAWWQVPKNLKEEDK